MGQRSFMNVSLLSLSYCTKLNIKLYVLFMTKVSLNYVNVWFNIHYYCISMNCVNQIILNI